MKKTILRNLVPLIYSVGVIAMATDIACREFAKIFGEEIRKRLLEFKLMGVVEIEIIDKNKKIKIEYHLLKGIRKYLDKFIKKNPKWKYKKEDCYGVITGRYILTRVYRSYNKKFDEEEDCCPECGRIY